MSDFEARAKAKDTLIEAMSAATIEEWQDLLAAMRKIRAHHRSAAARADTLARNSSFRPWAAGLGTSGDKG